MYSEYAVGESRLHLSPGAGDLRVLGVRSPDWITTHLL